MSTNVKQWSTFYLATACGLVPSVGCTSYDESLLQRAQGVEADGTTPRPGIDGGQPSVDAGGLAAPDCEPGPENCNGRDDDCDGRADEGAADSCEFDNASAECLSGGVCVLIECTTGFFDCNGLKRDGCETPLEEVACGECQRQCADGGAAEDDAGCTPASSGELCNGEDDDCDGDVDEGLLNSTEHCGSCGTACARDHGIASCQTGSCELVGCELGYADCDGNPDNGCEPEPCSGTCEDFSPSSRGATCDGCVCSMCQAEALNCVDNGDATFTSQCRAVIDCYASNGCSDCGGASTVDCTDCYDNGAGPCVAQVNIAAGGVDGADNSALLAGGCSASPFDNACAAASSFAGCRRTNCAADCP